MYSVRFRTAELVSKRWKEARTFSLNFSSSCLSWLVECVAVFVRRAYLDSMFSISKAGKSLMVGGGHFGDAGNEVLKGGVVCWVSC